MIISTDCGLSSNSPPTGFACQLIVFCAAIQVPVGLGGVLERFWAVLMGRKDTFRPYVLPEPQRARWVTRRTAEPLTRLGCGGYQGSSLELMGGHRHP